MIQLFNIPNYTIDTSEFSHYLHGKNVTEFEEKFAEYVGAKYAVSVNSATTAIFLIFHQIGITVNVPSMIPPVVLNGLITSGNQINFTDNTKWVGGAYTLHEFPDYKVIDSAQQVDRNQFAEMANDQDLMFFSFYPTKPVGSSDGGIIVSNDPDKIKILRTLSFNGMSYAYDNWKRKIIMPGYKAYMNSIQAYIADKNLDKLDEKKERLSYVRNNYNLQFGLNNISDHLYRLEVGNRHEFIGKMREEGIVCGIHYEAQHLNHVYTNGKFFDCPNSLIATNKTVSIPFHENLTNPEIVKIIENVKKYAVRRDTQPVK